MIDCPEINTLREQIEIEWNANENADLVDQLAGQYPNYALELYEFFALLIEVELEEQPLEGAVVVDTIPPSVENTMVSL